GSVPGMTQRELVVLGSSAQTPTRTRNHNGYALRWDGEILLFDPGEGTQRQLLLAGISAAKLTRICITHFHGDHCLGLPGVIQRLSLDQARGPVDVHYPAEGEVYFERLRGAAAFHETTPLRPHPDVAGTIAETDAFTLSAMALDHRVPTLGYRLVEPDSRRLVPRKLAEAGLSGPVVGQLRRDGSVTVDGRVITEEEVSEPRRGQRFAFVMDTRVCDAAVALAADADLLVCEATYLDADADLAERYAHLTARQAGRIATEAGARRLVLTHFSQRYADPQRFAEESGFSDVVLAEDFLRIPVPPRGAPD
ncbi:MAG TPA: ribonuclease Z, partial [Egibacteraceae bacterium]|nr:ribonuclease Z [Egibacteraceae bacterium]